MKISSNINLLLMIALVILIASTPNYVVIPEKFYKLISDKNNVILLLGLCFLVSYYNFNLGVLLALFIFVVMVNPPQLEGFASNNDPEEPETTEPETTEPETTDPPNNNNNSISSDCDGIMYDDYDEMGKYIEELGDKIADLAETHSDGSGGPSAENAKKFCEILNEADEKMEKVKDNMKQGEDFTQTANNPNNIIGEISETVNEAINGLNNNGGNNNILNNNGNNNIVNNNIENFTNQRESGNNVEGFMGATSNDAPLNETVDTHHRLDEQLRQNCGMKKSSNFDLVGCKYDLNGNFDNEFIQGPPVSKCGAYNMAKTQQIGTEFYPINP